MAIYKARALRNFIYKINDEFNDEGCTPEGYSFRVAANDNSVVQTQAEQEKLKVFEQKNINRKETGIYKIYPNPSNGVITIAYSGNSNAGYSISNIYGEVVYESKTQIQSYLTLNLKELGLARGIYYLSLFDSTNKKQCKKIVFGD